ncbi:hypothetical protein NC797_07165 [Aquibacillus sp. 3ASR75-11]|uniref:Uncharacterized protein n=1 Tax=Terrihalobacillus insolitus TaxID=2950438 RepID=A0A9X3WQL2_9BACI|nr:hypothetical protein [Terrihalobacillus insolitus]MDC3424287.1 hypothetical protein [Terrihalobacillus insolitus]
MYEELLKAINLNNRVIFLGNVNAGTSQVMKILLSMNVIENRTLIEFEKDIEFINKNLITNPSIEFRPYKSYVEIPSIIDSLEGKPYMAVVNTEEEYREKPNFNTYIGQAFDKAVYFKGANDYSINDVG